MGPRVPQTVTVRGAVLCPTSRGRTELLCDPSFTCVGMESQMLNDFPEASQYGIMVPSAAESISDCLQVSFLSCLTHPTGDFEETILILQDRGQKDFMKNCLFPK